MEKLEKTIEEIISEIPGREMTEEECKNFIEIDENDDEWWEIQGLKKPISTEDDIEESLDKTEEELGLVFVDGCWIDPEAGF